MNLLAPLTRAFWRKVRTIDPWEGSRQSYVVEYREALEQLAIELSTTESELRTRFNVLQRCAELVFKCDIVLFQITLHGEYGLPYEALITAIYLTDEQKDAIRAMFSAKPNLRVTFHNPK